MLTAVQALQPYESFRPRNPVPTLPTHYTVDEIASSLRLDKETVRRYIRIGKLSAIKVGREYRVPSKDLNDFMRNMHV